MPRDSTHSSTENEQSTRHRLMREAMQLFAQEGISGVSLRRVVQAAGAGNPSALHYHFGNRQALVAAIVEDLGQWLSSRWMAGLESDHFEVRSVLESLFDPVLQLQQEAGYGTAAVRFIARLAWDFGPEGQALSAQLHGIPLQRAEALLRPLLPMLDAEVLRFRLVVCMGHVYHGLADRSYLWRSPFGAMPLADKQRGAELRRHFYDYLEAGLRGPQQGEHAQ